jgi:hypothetical protein
MSHFEGHFEGVKKVEVKKGGNVYITSQYFFPAIIYRDIISHIISTYRYIMYFFRTFKKSTAPYKVHNMGLRYTKVVMIQIVYFFIFV